MERDRCARAREWSSLRADGELSELERLLLRRHLSRCASCRDFAGQLQTTTQLLRAAPVERPSRSLAPEVRSTRPRRRRYRIAVAAGFVAIAAATGGVVGSIVGGGGGGPAPAQRTPDIALRPDSTTVPVTPTPPPVETPGENV